MYTHICEYITCDVQILEANYCLMLNSNNSVKILHKINEAQFQME